MKMCIHYSLLRRLVIISYKVTFVFYCVVIFNIVVNFVGIEFSWSLLSFLFIIIYEVLGVVFKVYYCILLGWIKGSTVL